MIVYLFSYSKRLQLHERVGLNFLGNTEAQGWREFYDEAFTLCFFLQQIILFERLDRTV
jgi:hypothetical protein